MLTCSQLSVFAAQQNEDARDDFRYVIGREQLDWLVFCDETSIDMRATYRLHGWAKRGKRARLPESYVRGLRCVVSYSNCLLLTHIVHSFSVLPALTVDGLLFSQVRTGSFDGDEFLGFLDGLLPFMNPYPGPHSVLVLDNCGIHHVDGVRDRCEE